MIANDTVQAIKQSVDKTFEYITLTIEAIKKKTLINDETYAIICKMKTLMDDFESFHENMMLRATPEEVVLINSEINWVERKAIIASNRSEFVRLSESYCKKLN